MKNKDLNNLINDLKKISLTSEEKSVLLRKLDAYSVSHQPIKSPYYFSRPLTYVFASLGIIILIGGSTVFASEKALPGDVLYPIKIHVSEPLKVALATTHEAKDRVRVEHIEERLNEAEILAVQGRLASSTVVEINTSVKNNIDSIKGDLSEKNKDDLDIKMSAHSAVLKSIQDHSDDDQKANIQDVENVVHNSSRKDSKNNRVFAKEAKNEVKVIEVREFERDNRIKDEIKNIDKRIQKSAGNSFRKDKRTRDDKRD